MESPLDIALVIALCAAALAFVVWRFALTRKPPACATGGSAQEKTRVVLGKNLARGIARSSAGKVKPAGSTRG